ncbi:MAG: hypothetical protein ACREL2_04995, partial [Gemmatimonadales bacterium]
MRASSARLLQTSVRLSDLVFPTTGPMITRTRIAFIHLDNVMSFAKRDRDGQVDAWLAGYLPDEVVLLFFRRGEVVNAASLRSDGRTVVPIAEALRRIQAEPERGELSFGRAPLEQLAWMFGACAGPTQVRFVDPGQPTEFFNALAAESFTGVIEFISNGRVSYFQFVDGAYTTGYCPDRPEGVPVSAYVESLFKPGANRVPPAIMASEVPALPEIPQQALPAQVKLYREIHTRVLTGVEEELPVDGVRKHQRISGALRQQHPGIELLTAPEYGAGLAVAVTSDALTAALAVWVGQLLQEIDVVAPGAALRVIRQATKDQRYVLQAAGFYDRLPWPVTW